jgi:S1-C subfamily serine protease
MEPVIRQLQTEGYPVRKVDIDQSPQLAAKFGVSAVPCFILVSNGREVARIEGTASHAQLTQMFASVRQAPQPSLAELEIRGQSPDRVGLGGRLRSMVGGLRNHEAAPTQPSSVPPTVAEPMIASGQDHLIASGPEPPADLQPSTYSSTRGIANFASDSGVPPTANAPSRPAGVPAMAESFHANQLHQSPNTAAPAIHSTPRPAESGAPEERALAASVRLRIDDGQFYSYATGSIIAVQPNGEAMILTCGHVFRDSKGQGAIAVELFGSNRQGPLSGRLVACDLNNDLALVSVPIASPVAPVSVTPSEGYLREGARTFSIGCDRGAEPTVREGRITGINRYLGAPNLVASGRPVVGRSGGGLFDSEGRLVGVCRFADGHADEGIYVSYQAVHTQFAQWGHAALLKSSSGATPMVRGPHAGDSTISTVASSVATSDQPADFDYTANAGKQRNVANPLMENGVAASPMPDTINSSLFVVRATGEGKSDVMLLSNPSPEFLSQLGRESAVRLSSTDPLPAAVRDAAANARLTPQSNGNVLRGQSPTSYVASPMSFNTLR